MYLLIDHKQGPAAAEQTVARVRAWAGEHGFGSKLPRGAGGVWDQVMSVSGPEALAEHDWKGELLAIEGVLAVNDGPEAIFRVIDPEKTASAVTLADARFGLGDTSLIAGPCSVESLDELLPLAHQLRKFGATALRAGAYKPRTSPYGFPGLAQVGLEILSEVSTQTGLAIVTEVLDQADLDLVTQHADMLQIGSRNMGNGALLRAVGGSGLPVLLKRGMSATISEFLQAAEFLANAGSDRIILCERGLRHFDHELRNLLDLSAVPLLQQRSHLPVVVDPSHGTGRADLVPTMMVAAAAAGADGLLVEVHSAPEKSVSDADQAITPSQFEIAAQKVAAVLNVTGRTLVTASSEFSAPSV
jgi:3-deoxy-7-phosphoheptulonate synthase